MRLDGRYIHGLPIQTICQRGLARSFQITSLFRTSSISENIRLSLQARHPAAIQYLAATSTATRMINAETTELIRFLGLEGIEDIQAGELSYGGQRLVDLGIALGSKPQVLMLDEPLAGLAAAERERVSGLDTERREEHPRPDRRARHRSGARHSRGHVTVMNQGEVLMTGSPDEVRNDRRVQEVYTGTGTPPATERIAGDGKRERVLRFENVNAFYGESHILSDASLDVREGEIVALLGRNGAGKSTLLKTLCGLVPPASGHIEFESRTSEVSRARNCPHGRQLCAAGTRFVCRHDGCGQSCTRAVGAKDRRQYRRGLDRRKNPQFFPASEGPDDDRGGLSFRR